jgi:hypothetical protein
MGFKRNLHSVKHLDRYVPLGLKMFDDYDKVAMTNLLGVVNR